MEDDGIVARDLKGTVERLGYRTLGICRTADSAVETVRRDEPDLVLMDIRLPGAGDGILAGRRIMAQEDVPVVYVTAYADSGTLERASDTAPFGYILKPFDEQDLTTAIEIALHRHRLERTVQTDREKLAATLRCIGDAVIATDPDGNIVLMNSVACRLTGWSEESALGRPIEEVIRLRTQGTDAPVDNPVLEALREQKTVELEEDVRLVSRDGQEIPITDSAAPIRLDGSRAVGSVMVFRDITERQRSKRALRRSERRYRLLFEENVAGVYRSTPDGEVLEANQAFAQMLDYADPDELVGRQVAELYASADERRQLIRELERRGRARNYELQLRRRDGSVLWGLESSVLAEDPDRDQVQVIGTVIDITRRKALETELAEMAYHDPLTGLANRRLLKETADQFLALAERAGNRVGLVYLDLERFKRVNDTLGHESGDRVLVEVGRRLERGARASDTVARIGGDEFAVLVTNVEEPKDGPAAARRLVDALEGPLEIKDRTLRVNARIGVALFPDHADDFQALLSAADAAMYHSKREEDGRIHVAESASTAGKSDALTRPSALRSALEEELTVHFQPVLRLSARAVTGAEAVARWRHPSRGLLPADDFLPLAERTGLVARLDRQVVDEVLRGLARLDENDPIEWVSVNLSAASLDDPGLTSTVADLLDRHRVAPERLVFEVSEATAMGDPEGVAARMEELRDLGAGVTLDDFGTGPSALPELRSFQPAMLKIDRPFTRQLGSGHRHVVEGIVQLGRAVGADVVLQGVESEAEFEAGIAAGCEYLQGYYVGKPVPLSVLSG